MNTGSRMIWMDTYVACRSFPRFESHRCHRTNLVLRACDFIEVAAAMAAIFVESKPLS